MQNRTLEMMQGLLQEAKKYDLIGSLPELIEVMTDDEDGDE